MKGLRQRLNDECYKTHFHYFNFILQFMNASEKAPGAQQMGVLCVRRCNNTSTQIPGLQTGQRGKAEDGTRCCCHLCCVRTCGQWTLVTRTLVPDTWSWRGSWQPSGRSSPEAVPRPSPAWSRCRGRAGGSEPSRRCRGARSDYRGYDQDI